MWEFPTVKSETHFFLFDVLTALGFFGDVNDFPFIFDGFLIEKSRPMLKVSLKAACLFLWKGPGEFNPPHIAGTGGGIGGGGMIGPGVHTGGTVGPGDPGDPGDGDLGKSEPKGYGDGDGPGGDGDDGLGGLGKSDPKGYDDGLGDGDGEGNPDGDANEDGLADGDANGEPLGDADGGDAPDPRLPEEGLIEAKTPITDMMLGDDAPDDGADATRDTSDGLNDATEGID